MTNFSDVIKGKFLEEFSAISVGHMLTAVALAFVLSLFIVLIYRMTFAGVSVDRGFISCLIMLSVVTTLVILVVSSNVVLSLGMVGALSIVRFRTAIKSPADTAFLFWSIATGIVCGAGYVTVAILSALLMGILFVGIYFFSGKQKAKAFMVVVHYTLGCEAIKQLEAMPGYSLRNKTVSGEEVELVADLQLTAQTEQQVEQLGQEPGVRELSLMRAVNTSL